MIKQLAPLCLWILGVIGPPWCALFPEHVRAQEKRDAMGTCTAGSPSGSNCGCDFQISDAELLKKLTPEQYRITQMAGTERPFENQYWNNKQAGIYVDIVSGEPLFSSTDKFDSGTGWPSFTKPIRPESLKEHSDTSHGMQRIEVRSAGANSHLGHVFDDGPAPSKLRYCINSAALRFIPVTKLKEEGYQEYLPLFRNQGTSFTAKVKE